MDVEWCNIVDIDIVIRWHQNREYIIATGNTHRVDVWECVSSRVNLHENHIFYLLFNFLKQILNKNAFKVQ